MTSRTNLDPDPSCTASGNPPWFHYNNSTVAVDANHFLVGTTSVLITFGISSGLCALKMIPLPTGATGQPFSAAFYARSNTGHTESISCYTGYYQNGSGAGTASKSYNFTIPASGDWVRIVLPCATDAPSNANNLGVLISANGVTIGDSINVDAFMVEQTVEPGSYFDGSSTDDAGWLYAWTGVANNSTSTATTAARPSLQLLVTPPGGAATDYSKYLAFDGASQQLTITQNFGRQGDTAQMTLVDDYADSGTPNIGSIPPTSQIRLTDNNLGKVLFAGVITNPALVVTGPNRNEWVLNCTDYTFYADHAVCRGTYTNYGADDLVIALTEQANCGIGASEIRSGGYVAPGPVIGQWKTGWKSLSDAWRTIAKLAGSVVPYGWYVDENRELHFFDQTRAPASGVTFTTTPTEAYSVSEGHFALDSSFQYEWDATSLENQILVQGGSQSIKTDTTGSATDVFYGDGVTTAWPLRYTLSGNPQKLTINGVPEVVGNAGIGGTWTTSQNKNGQWFLSVGTPPPAGSVIMLWYDYQIQIIGRVNDYQSQATYTGPNGGVYAAFINDSSVTTATMAFARAQRERQEYAFAAERITFNTTEEWYGWVRAGDVVTIDCAFIPDSQRNWALGVNASFIIVQNQVSFGQGGFRTMQVTAVRV